MGEEYICVKEMTGGIGLSIEYVPKAKLVRCKDCIYWEDERARMNQTSWLPCMEVHTGGKWYCADGRKKDDSTL